MDELTFPVEGELGEWYRTTNCQSEIVWPAFSMMYYWGLYPKFYTAVIKVE